MYLVLEFILQRVRLRAKRRIAWLRKLWQEEGESGGQLAVTHAEIDSYLEQRDSPEAEYAWYSSEKNMKQLNKEIIEVEEEIASADDSRFATLIKTFKLSQEESDLFQLCLALKLDPSLSRIYAYLHDHAARGYSTEQLTLRLFGHGYGSILQTGSALRKWELIIEKETAPGEPNVLNCDPYIIQWLLGYEGFDEVIEPFTVLHPAQKPLKNWPVKNTMDILKRILKDDTKHVRVNTVGSPRSGRRTFAAIICLQFNKHLISIDSDQVENWQLVFTHAQRQALLGNYGIAWFGEKVFRQNWPQNISSIPLQFIIGEKNQKPAPANGIIDFNIEMPELLISEQQELIKKLVPVSQTWNNEEFKKLTTQHRLNVGDFSMLSDRNVQMINEVIAVIKETARHKLGELARLLECPFKWDDIILPAYLKEALEDFVFEARERKQFWEKDNARNLFPQGRGLIALFSGPPGTGKTMAVQVIAAELGLDLFRIDLSSVVSKYVGETSQNLERILSRAENMDIVLLFDEADALFGKRTEIRDAHDRFANTDTNYLLQAIENYRGIAILATNKKENIESAFIRRLRYVFEFPKPDANHREQIWFKVADKLLNKKNWDSLKKSLSNLAVDIETTGSQIKFALLSAIFIAQKENKPLAIKHLVRGLERELMKEGRTISSREREKLLNNG